MRFIVIHITELESSSTTAKIISLRIENLKNVETLFQLLNDGFSGVNWLHRPRMNGDRLSSFTIYNNMGIRFEKQSNIMKKLLRQNRQPFTIILDVYVLHLAIILTQNYI